MRPSRRSSISSVTQSRSNSLRIHGRVTQEDIRAASLRRWDGRARVTTDWVNLYQEPELCYPDGDLLIYLREPGQSSRGPAFRVHKSLLKQRGFEFLLDKCIDRPSLHPGTECLLSSCHGCEVHSLPSELYIPAPADAELDEVFDHHITTRNFFAWLYDIPLAGRALGRSLVNLKERIDYYKPDSTAKSGLDIVSFAEAQCYLDFRECVDHALAALLLAEHLQIEDLWIDAFAHCVGMSSRGLNTSLEYWAISYDTRLLINNAQHEMELRLESMKRSVYDFFEHDLSDAFLGLSPVAREHLNHFRSWLHSYHIDQYGFWPPNGFEEQAMERDVYAAMYFDFRNLYDHLVDPTSSTGISDLHLSASGGFCVAQNVQAFDARHHYNSLPQTMPLLPTEPEAEIKISSLQRRKSWNPVTKRKVDKDKRRALRVKALIDASNRDWAVMGCPLVRRYSEFEEEQILFDDAQSVSMIEGRKIRWILVYAILQTLISTLQTPSQVRNVDSLSYLLCCRSPDSMPWQNEAIPKKTLTPEKTQSAIEPDTQYKHSNTSVPETTNNLPSLTLNSLKEIRRRSLPLRAASTASRPSSSRSVSLRRLIGRTDSTAEEIPPVPKTAGFCEILIQGYGNGLNEVDAVSVITEDLDTEETPSRVKRRPLAIVTEIDPFVSHTAHSPSLTDRLPELTPTSTVSVSRESSIASTSSTYSKSLPRTDSDPDLPVIVSSEDEYHHSPVESSKEMFHTAIPSRSKRRSRPISKNFNHVFDEDGLLTTVHFNTETWDNFLSAL